MLQFLSSKTIWRIQSSLTTNLFLMFQVNKARHSLVTGAAGLSQERETEGSFASRAPSPTQSGQGPPPPTPGCSQQQGTRARALEATPGRVSPVGGGWGWGGSVRGGRVLLRHWPPTFPHFPSAPQCLAWLPRGDVGPKQDTISSSYRVPSFSPSPPSISKYVVLSLC